MKQSLKSKMLGVLQAKYPMGLTHAEVEGLGEVLGALGDTLRRRCYDLEREGQVKIEKRVSANGKTYSFFTYIMPQEESKRRQVLKETGRIKIEVVTLPTGERVAKEILV